MQVGGQFFPNKPINDIARPSEGYQYLIQSLTQGGGITKSYGTTVSRSTYCVTTATVTGQDTTFTVPAAGIRGAVVGNDDIAASRNVSQFPNSFFCGYDLEKVLVYYFKVLILDQVLHFLIYLYQNQLVMLIYLHLSMLMLGVCLIQVNTISKQVTAFI